jgi:hypothetical protein
MQQSGGGVRPAALQQVPAFVEQLLTGQ